MVNAEPQAETRPSTPSLRSNLFISERRANLIKGLGLAAGGDSLGAIVVESGIAQNKPLLAGAGAVMIGLATIVGGLKAFYRGPSRIPSPAKK